MKTARGSSSYPASPLSHEPQLHTQPKTTLQLAHFLIGYFISRIGDALYTFVCRCSPID